MSNSKRASYIVDDFFRHTKIIVVITLATIALSTLTLLYFKFAKSSDQDPKDNTPEVIRFQSENIPLLQLGHYTLWAVDSSGEYIFIKRFNALDGLTSLNTEPLTELRFEPYIDATMFAVTIEPEGDRNEDVNGIPFLQGEVVNNLAKLEFVYPSLLSPAPSGSYILASPSDGNNRINEKSGIWFTDESANNSSLNLITPPSANWIWEARLEIEQSELLLGRFTSPVGPDNSNNYSEIIASGFNYPGEDLLTNLPEKLVGPLNLANGKYKVIISLEPNNSFSEDPTGQSIFIPILESEIEATYTEQTSYPLSQTKVMPNITLSFE